MVSRRRLAVLCWIVVAATFVSADAQAGPPHKEDRDASVDLQSPADGPRGAASEVTVFVQLADPSGVDTYVDAVSTRGRGVAAAVTASQIARLESAQAGTLSRMRAAGINYRVLYQVQRVLNGFAVTMDGARVKDVAALAGVKAVLPMAPKFPTLSTSVPFLNVPAELWANRGLTGSGVKIGIIDTGIDYLHPMFGGSGNAADYTADDTTVANAFFPTTKVVGGYDFAGDAYTGGNAPAPDPNPMDCNGHGSH